MSRATDIPAIASARGEDSICAGDGDVLAALEAGDRDRALTLLMRSYGQTIYRYCHRMVGPGQVDDVHQITFVQAYESLERFRGDSSLRTWLYGIARHRCLDMIRKQRRHGPSADKAPEKQDPKSGADQRIAARDVLRKCLGNLKPEVREAVILRYQEGYSYPEMAKICGEEPATLQMRVARAMRGLRKCIESRSYR